MLCWIFLFFFFLQTYLLLKVLLKCLFFCENEDKQQVSNSSFFMSQTPTKKENLVFFALFFNQHSFKKKLLFFTILSLYVYHFNLCVAFKHMNWTWKKSCFYLYSKYLLYSDPPENPFSIIFLPEKPTKETCWPIVWPQSQRQFTSWNQFFFYTF